MTIRSNVHTHTTWCDGTDTPRQMAEAALALGFTDLGFSSHAPAKFDPTCPGVASEADYQADIAAVKAEYAGRLAVLCGIEQDACAPVNAASYDYVIGSTHYLPLGNEYVAVDNSPEMLRLLQNEQYGSSSLAMATDFFTRTVAHTQRDKPTVVGHFDLIAKFNRTGAFFDEESAAYKRAALDGMDALLDIVDSYGGLVEVNTGAMARGLRSVPYPAPFLLRHMAGRKARVIITSDSHQRTKLNAHFEQAQALLAQAGFRSMVVLQNGRFQDVLLDA
ncbi:MAG: histidinol-phosphatase HisJ family protein [Ruminococcaceae bacterium]|nr:histidinol-phosphatase HisJ family protein [Oscillospiraceae bacterium]